MAAPEVARVAAKGGKMVVARVEELVGVERATADWAAEVMAVVALAAVVMAVVALAAVAME